MKSIHINIIFILISSPSFIWGQNPDNIIAVFDFKPVGIERRQAEKITERPFNWCYSETNRTGDHIWWVSDISKFQRHYPNWPLRYDIDDIMNQVMEGQAERLHEEVVS